MSSTTELDIENPEHLVRYLRSIKLIRPDESIEAQILAGGVSNRTMLVTRPGGTQWVVKQALEKLRVQVDWFSDPVRIHREADGLEWLESVLPSKNVPALVFDDYEKHIIGMTAVPQPHESWKTVLLNGTVESDAIRQFGQILAKIHQPLPTNDDDLEDLFEAFGDRSFFESLRLEPYYAYSATQVSEASQFLNRLIEKTMTRQFSVVHGDYSPKNVLVYQGDLVILDYEVIHIGDPAFDLGFSLTHLLSKAHYVKSSRQTFLDAALLYWQTYREYQGEMPYSDFEASVVEHTLACLLARAVGRSPLEYLNSAQRERQTKIVLNILKNQPSTVPQLIDRFGNLLEQ